MRVLVIGDACIDEYRFGEIRRLNPESACPLIHVVKTDKRKGMAHNVAQNLSALGIDVQLAAPHEVCHKIRYIDQKTGEHLLRVDHDVKANPYKVGSLDVDAVVISDYDKGFVSYEVVQEIRNTFSGPIYMDTKKTDLGRFEGVYIKINQLEYDRAVSFPDEDYLIVTCGASGARHQGKLYEAPRVEVIDVCGAGDVFLAAFVANHLQNGSVEQAIEFANQKAALSCTKIGTVCVS